MKPFCDFSGISISKKALKHFKISRNVKFGGSFATALMVFQSTSNFGNGGRSALNYFDGGIGLMGLGYAFICLSQVLEVLR